MCSTGWCIIFKKLFYRIVDLEWKEKVLGIEASSPNIDIWGESLTSEYDENRFKFRDQMNAIV